MTIMDGQNRWAYVSRKAITHKTKEDEVLGLLDRENKAYWVKATEGAPPVEDTVLYDDDGNELKFNPTQFRMPREVGCIFNCEPLMVFQ